MAEPKLLDQYRERLLEPLRTQLERVKVLLDCAEQRVAEYRAG